MTVHYGYNYTSDPDQPEWFVQQWLAYYGTAEHVVAVPEPEVREENAAAAQRRQEL